MRDDHFEWGDAKAASNLADHKISFEEARLAFDDPFAIDEPDLSEDYDEDRYVLTGVVAARILVVTYTERGDRTRIISARRANAYERSRYAHGRQ